MFPEYTPEMLIEDPKGERWITIMGRHVKIDGNGNIIAGLGGKFNGKSISHAADHLSSPEGSKKNKVTPESSSKKIKQAISIIKNNRDLSTKELKDIFMKNLGMSPGGAAVYLTKAKKKLADEESSKKSEDKPVEKEKSKKESPVVKKTEDKSEKKEEKSDNKMKQAEAIYKAMPGATSKEVQAKFKSQIGMSPGMASLYYHKLKKKFGNIESTDDKKHLEPMGDDDLKAIAKEMDQEKKEKIDPIDATIYNEYMKKKKILKSWDKLKDDGKMGLDDLYDVMQAVKKQHPDHKIHNDPFALADKMTSINKMDDAALHKMSGKYQGIDGKSKSQEKQVDTKDKKSSQDTDITKKTEISTKKDEKTKKLEAAYDKYESGVINKAEAIKQIYTDLGIDAWDAAKMWKDHEDKIKEDKEEKQKIADDLYHEGKKKGLTQSEIGLELQKKLGGTLNSIIPHIEKAADNHLDKGYKHYKTMKFQGGDDYAITGAIQKHLGLSYDDSWNMLSQLNLKHEKESKNHLAKAVDIIEKHSHKTYGEKVDHVGYELGLNPEEAEQMTNRAHQEIKETQKHHAKDLYKKAHHKGEDANDTIQKIEDVLKVSSLEAKKLYNIAKNSFSPEELEKGYDAVKAKIDKHHGGADVKYNHGENVSIPEPEHVKTYHSKVTLAKSVNAHKAFDFHEHLVNPNSLEFYKQKQSVKDTSNAVYEYTGSSYQEINNSLRNGDKNFYNKKTINNLDKAFKHKSAKVKKDTMVYRGFTSEFANNFEPGDVLHDKGFMSTTSEEHKANSWATTYGAVLHILLPKGASAMTVRNCSKFSNEEEVLVNRNAKIRIISKESRNDLGGVTLYGEYIIDDEPKKKLSPLERLQKKAAEAKENS